MKNLPVDTLRAFVTVVEVGGFTAAGELLGRSQPAISLQLKRLETTLGQALLARNGQQLELTRAGAELIGYAKKILALNDEAVAAFDSNQVSGSLHLGIPSEFASTLLPKIVSRFSQTYPNVALEVTSDLSRNLLADLARKRFDLVLALHDNPGAAGRELIKVDDLVWTASAAYDPHHHPALPLVAAPEGCIYRQRAIRLLDRRKLPWRIVFTIPDLSGIRTAIEEGLGVTVLAKSTVPGNLKIMRPSAQFPPLGKIGISVVSAGGKQSEAASRLADYLQAGLAGH